MGQRGVIMAQGNTGLGGRGASRSGVTFNQTGRIMCGRRQAQGGSSRPVSAPVKRSSSRYDNPVVSSRSSASSITSASSNTSNDSVGSQISDLVEERLTQLSNGVESTWHGVVNGVGGFFGVIGTEVAGFIGQFNPPSNANNGPSGHTSLQQQQHWLLASHADDTPSPQHSGEMPPKSGSNGSETANSSGSGSSPVEKRVRFALGIEDLKV